MSVVTNRMKKTVSVTVSPDLYQQARSAKLNFSAILSEALRLPTRLNPLIEIDGQSFVIMTHQMASVAKSLLGSEVADAISSRDQIKRAIDLLIDGF